MRQPTQVQGGHVQDQGRADPHFFLVNKAANHMHIQLMIQPTQVQKGGHVQDQGRADLPSYWSIKQPTPCIFSS